MKTTLLFLFSLIGLFAQGNGTTTSFLLITDNANANNVLYGPVNTFGQTSHQFTIVYRDAPGQTCTNGRDNGTYGLQSDPTVELVGKFSASADIQLVLPFQVINALYGTTPNMRFSRTINTTNISPYLYIQFQQTNFTTCRATVYYGGTTVTFFKSGPNTSPSFVNAINATTIQAGNLKNDNQTFTVDNTATVLTLNGVSGIAQGPPTRCYRSGLYGLIFSNPNAFPVQVYFFEDLSDDLSVIPIKRFIVAANSTTTLQTSDYPFYITRIGSTVVVQFQNLTSPSTVGGTISMAYAYKGE